MCITLRAEPETGFKKHPLFGGDVDDNKDVGCGGGGHVDRKLAAPTEISCARPFPSYVLHVRSNNIVINVLVHPQV